MALSPMKSGGPCPVQRAGAEPTCGTLTTWDPCTTSLSPRYDGPPPPLLGGRYSASDVHSRLLLRQEHLLKEGSPQRAWLDADLRKADANRDQQPWIVVVWLPRAWSYLHCRADD